MIEKKRKKKILRLTFRNASDNRDSVGPAKNLITSFV